MAATSSSGAGAGRAGAQGATPTPPPAIPRPATFVAPVAFGMVLVDRPVTRQHPIARQLSPQEAIVLTLVKQAWPVESRDLTIGSVQIDAGLLERMRVAALKKIRRDVLNGQFTVVR